MRLRTSETPGTLWAGRVSPPERGNEPPESLLARSWVRERRLRAPHTGCGGGPGGFGKRSTDLLALHLFRRLGCVLSGGSEDPCLLEGRFVHPRFGWAKLGAADLYKGEIGMVKDNAQWILILFIAVFGMHAANSPAAAACVSGETTLCLSGARFGVTAEWQTPNGITGIGRAVPLTADTGYFWFFNPANVEVIVKIVNGCSLNQRYWVFAGGLTNVKVTLRATDYGSSGRLPTKTFSNPQNTPFQPIQSTDAFACGRPVRG